MRYGVGQQKQRQTYLEKVADDVGFLQKQPHLVAGVRVLRNRGGFELRNDKAESVRRDEK